MFAFEGDAADESKHTEEALRRSEAELRDIVDQMQDTFYRTNLEGQMKCWPGP